MKKSPKITTYRDYKKFNTSDFKRDLHDALRESSTDISYNNFDEMVKKLLNKHAPMKKKKLRNNSAPFMTKQLRKEIMLRSRRRNQYNEDPSAATWNTYRIQRNKCTKLVREAKRSFYSSLNLKLINVFLEDCKADIQ